jgi:thioredoxin-related protein
MTPMQRRVVATSIALCFMCGLTPVHGEDGLWQTDFEAAKAKAKAEKKFLLVDFTGSDWCIWCKRLNAEVFDKDEFQKEAPKHFVLVEVDFPAPGKKLAGELKQLQKRYKIQGFPTVLVIDSDGLVVAQTGYQPGGPEAYVKQLSEFLNIYATVLKLKKDLDSSKGVARAKLLDKLIDANVKLNRENDVLTGWSKEIVSLDTNNKAGLKIKHEFRLCMAEYLKLKEKHKINDAKAVLKKALALSGISAEQKQACYMAQGELCLVQGDFAGIVKSLHRAVEVDPKSKEAVQAKTTIERLKPIVDAQEAVAKLKSQLDGTSGVDRAKLLDKLINAQTKLVTITHTPSQAGLRDIEKWSREIVTLDADNKAGLKTKYEFHGKINDANAQIRSKDFDRAQKTLDEAAALPNLSGEQKSKIAQLRKHLAKDRNATASTATSEK